MIQMAKGGGTLFKEREREREREENRTLNFFDEFQQQLNCPSTRPLLNLGYPRAFLSPLLLLLLLNGVGTIILHLMEVIFHIAHYFFLN